MAQVLLFGWFAERAGWCERKIDAPSLSTLQAILSEQLPEVARALASGKGRSAVNQAIQTDDVTLRDGDEVAFFPPFSGG